MGLNINGITLSSTGSGIALTNTETLNIYNNGNISSSGVPAFTAGNNSPGAWVAATAGSWNTPVFNSIGINVGSCFNTSTNRFTAPISGKYFFRANAYCEYGVANTDYMHPVFGKNGSSTGMYSSYTTYRIRHYGDPNINYHCTEISEVMSLAAGDYIQYYLYCNTATCKWYTGYMCFSGVYLG